MPRQGDPHRDPDEDAAGRGPADEDAQPPRAVPDAGEDPGAARRRAERPEEERRRAAGEAADEDAERPDERDAPRRLSGRDVRRLVFATYRASLPYFLVFLLVMALATWLVTEVLF